VLVDVPVTILVTSITIVGGPMGASQVVNVEDIAVETVGITI